ncbi:hypothetical protein RF11_11297 [Thelohanellus kitauei]|uniref:Uncharacterized protein n=1 Tax=Thelohanellus kitauei TaxID=669202 RepID=A0A0C2IWG2_THEKT|nr:hypothetical protein RF11_11297 [Thelohanellus kitauei]
MAKNGTRTMAEIMHRICDAEAFLTRNIKDQEQKEVSRRYSNYREEVSNKFCSCCRSDTHTTSNCFKNYISRDFCIKNKVQIQEGRPYGIVCVNSTIESRQIEYCFIEDLKVLKNLSTDIVLGLDFMVDNQISLFGKSLKIEEPNVRTIADCQILFDEDDRASGLEKPNWYAKAIHPYEGLGRTFYAVSKSGALCQKKKYYNQKKEKVFGEIYSDEAFSVINTDVVGPLESRHFITECEI